MEKSSGKVVVAVDDTVDNVDLVKRIVTPVGYSFHGCTDGKAFLSLLADIQPDLILLDVEMPGLDGFELCRTLRQRPETANTPVLFVTGRNSHADLQRALAVGGNDFVVKPYDIVKLRTRIAHWIARAASPETSAPKIGQAKPVLGQNAATEAAHPSMLQSIIRPPTRPPERR